MSYFLESSLPEVQAALNACREVALKALCLRSHGGAVVATIADGAILGSGFNGPADGLPLPVCVKHLLPPDFRSDKTCCVHSEQNAILDALATNAIRMAAEPIRMYFLRLDSEGNPAPSGKPYCTICSKLTQAAGISEFALLRPDDVIEVWSADEYNRVSFAHADPEAS